MRLIGLHKTVFCLSTQSIHVEEYNLGKKDTAEFLPRREARFPFLSLILYCHKITFLSREDEAKMGPIEQKAQDVTSPVCTPLRVIKFSPVAIDQRIILPSTEQVARVSSFGSTAQ